jgi:hypothetical protein
VRNAAGALEPIDMSAFYSGTLRPYRPLGGLLPSRRAALDAADAAT